MRLRSYYHWLTDRKGYFLARQFGVRIPLFPLIFLPDGFTVRQAGDSGITIVDNFCTREEADYLIELAKPKLRDSLITLNNTKIKDDYRTSKTAIVFEPNDQDPAILPLLYRAGMLVGQPPTHVETVFVTRYQAGEYYRPHEDYYEGFDGDRLYTVLIYLNDMGEEDGGGTVFEELNVGVTPKLGRAVIWANQGPDGSVHPESRHEALPVAPGAEKWAIQLWFRNYKMINLPKSAIATPQTKMGKALSGDEELPEGAWAPGDVAADSPYGKAFE
ncbi:MAG: 2OG-Fe(II) oxygenase [Gammaproteobacteria bacterium]|nr:2OG-Fe(II) oxygenase [Gammaproteobacteria bacterium]MDP6617594.1 2OG-Fe(II) oxygenase [Gammaproteobacteria bacterium]MDP6694471.1 2OG-Fe(II) oxygenase [Gammaproteobacteria bacterium]